MITLVAGVIIKKRSPFVDLSYEIFWAAPIHKSFHTLRVVCVGLAAIESIAAIWIAVDVKYPRPWADSALQEPGPEHGYDMRKRVVVITVVFAMKEDSWKIDFQPC